MDLMISEVQISCVILMGLITLIFVYVLPGYEVAGKTFTNARKLLACGTFLITLHFILQNFVQKQMLDNLYEIRTTINLIFGIPMSYCFYLSYLYLQRQGKIDKKEWLFGPIVYVLNITVLLLSVILEDAGFTTQVANYVMAFLYASILIYYSSLQLKEYRKIIFNLRHGRKKELLPLVKSTRWSLFIMTMIAFGFPFMTFTNNLLLRSFYGVLSISSAFFYIFSFIIYGIKFDYEGYVQSMKELTKNAEKERLIANDAKVSRILEAIDKFTKEEYYRRPSLTLKEAADLMNIPVSRLKLWLQTTEYEKFNNWINVLRINKAKEMMLLSPTDNIESIAERCGFCDRPYFSRQFTKQEGTTPTKWLKSVTKHMIDPKTSPMNEQE